VAVADIDTRHEPYKDSTKGLTDAHQPYEAVREQDRDWETLRWPGQFSKMLFHPRPERPTEPNAGLVRFEPGGWHPVHNHDYAQIWYILEGEFKFGDVVWGPGTMIFHPDPHVEAAGSTETGGLLLIVQYQGPTTGGGTIYEGRFNMEERVPWEEERIDI
jgi:hypothetical protein